MSAIFGLWRFDVGGVSTDIKKMDSALSIYGSDECGILPIGRSLALGRRLHRCVPEDGFVTPIDAGGRYVVIADVRLTERDDLAEKLGFAAKASTMSDAAIAVAALEAWNEEAFDRIYGSFAIAAWDRASERLLLARDHLGLKPLFYHSSGKLFAFASMPVGLQSVPEVPRGPDMGSMTRFLAHENPQPERTHFEEIRRIMPGHYAVVTKSGVGQTRYWRPDLTPLRLATHEDYAKALASQLDRAVHAALRGAGSHVGAQLSSGFDSTAIATTAARLLAPSGGRVVAYTAAPRQGYEKTLPGRLADESALAAATAALHPNMDHVVMRSDRSALADLERTAAIYGGPVFNICNEPWYDAINDDAAGRGISIMLEGANGNATISETGFLALPELVRERRFLTWFRIASGLVRRGHSSWSRTFWKSFNRLLPNWLYRGLMERRFGRLASGSGATALKDSHLHQATLDAARESPVSNEQGVLSGGWIRPTGNSLSDRLILLESDTGASSKGMLGEWKIDYRDPTADRRLVEFSLRVPVEQLIYGGQPRALLRKVLADRVPPQVLDNPIRGYQGADWHEWLNQDREKAIEEVAHIEAFEPASRIIDVERLKALIRDWPEPRSECWTEYSTTLDYRVCLLRAISAASFMRQAAGLNH